MSEKVSFEEALLLFNTIFDEAYREYSSMELNESEIKELVYSSKVYLHSFSENRKCSVKYCRKKAVKSHLFQESILRKNSHNGHFIYPASDLDKKKIKISKIGINKALTFPGFCETHENMFEYEKKEQLDYEHELRTLIYKAICYHNVYWEIVLKKTENSINELIKKRHEKFERSTNGKYRSLFKALNIELKDLHFTDPRHNDFDQFLKKRKKTIKETLIFKRLAWKDIELNKDENLSSHTIEIDKVIPIFFCYLGNLTIKNEDLEFNNMACVIIHPFKESTKLIFTTKNENFGVLKKLLDRLDIDSTLNFILSSLLYVSDNWLMNENFYNKYIPVKLKAFLESAHTLPLSPKNSNL
ncbi:MULTISPECIES: hypothetical protein [unclassified Chryseobacterium]|uniref:hypothetical protein n=1 Tax=unclassified Chryseobacterium TaxID=2593645 RepID=UPI0012FCFB8B|nr:MULTISPECIES: hypothetical protein [unclassified Chryseobacterium]